MRKLSIREWAREDRPREKLLLQGPQHLSNAELLAILIQNGTRENSALDVAKNMLLYAHNDLNQLAGMSVQELVNGRIAGLGTAKAVMIAAAMELGVRRKAAGHFRIKIQSSKDVANYLQAQLEHRKQEIFAVVYLNRGNRILSLETISILKKALEQDATALVLCHNHPSGNLTPSRADEQLTQKIKQAAALMDIQVLDHIIVSHEGYFSFADEGMI
jgi:DNA repair protein RadC